jgi:hypothetical protein
VIVPSHNDRGGLAEIEQGLYDDDPRLAHRFDTWSVPVGAENQVMASDQGVRAPARLEFERRTVGPSQRVAADDFDDRVIATGSSHGIARALAAPPAHL